MCICKQYDAESGRGWERSWKFKTMALDCNFEMLRRIQMETMLESVFSLILILSLIRSSYKEESFNLFKPTKRSTTLKV